MFKDMSANNPINLYDSDDEMSEGRGALRGSKRARTIHYERDSKVKINMLRKVIDETRAKHIIDMSHDESDDSYDERRNTSAANRQSKGASGSASTDASKYTSDYVDIKNMAKRKEVEGNGTCWLYAFMACLHIYEGDPTPSRRDYKISSTILENMKLHSMDMALNQSLLSEIKSWTVATANKNGTYGGGLDSTAILASLFNYQIMVLDKSKKNDIMLFIGDSTGKTRQYSASDALRHLKAAQKSGTKIAVIEFNGKHMSSSGHFVAYVQKQANGNHEIKQTLDKIESYASDRRTRVP